MFGRYNEEPKKKFKLLKDDKKYPKWLEWIRDYGYYYKGWIAVAVILVIIALCFAYLVGYQGADMRLYVVTGDETLKQEDYFAFVEKMSEYVTDVDGDRSAFLRDSCYVLTEGDKKGLEKLDDIINDSETLGFVVDEEGYEYIKSKTTLRDMAFYQVVSDEEDRLRINDSPFFEGLTLGDGRDYYVIMRYFEPEDYNNNIYLSLKTDLWVGFMLNNDLSEENNVEIK